MENVMAPKGLVQLPTVRLLRPVGFSVPSQVPPGLLEVPAPTLPVSTSPLAVRVSLAYQHPLRSAIMDVFKTAPTDELSANDVLSRGDLAAAGYLHSAVNYHQKRLAILGALKATRQIRRGRGSMTTLFRLEKGFPLRDDAGTDLLDEISRMVRSNGEGDPAEAFFKIAELFEREGRA